MTPVRSRVRACGLPFHHPSSRRASEASQKPHSLSLLPPFPTQSDSQPDLFLRIMQAEREGFITFTIDAPANTAAESTRCVYIFSYLSFPLSFSLSVRPPPLSSLPSCPRRHAMVPKDRTVVASRIDILSFPSPSSLLISLSLQLDLEWELGLA